MNNDGCPIKLDSHRRFFLRKGYLNVLYDSICMVTPMASAIKRRRRAQCSATKMAQHESVSQSVEMATIFTRRGMARWAMKFEI